MRKLGMGVLIGGLRQNSATFLKPNHRSLSFTTYNLRAEEISPRRTAPSRMPIAILILLGQTQKSVPGKGHMRHIAPSFVYKGCFWE